MSADTPKTIWVVNDAGHPTWLAKDLLPSAEIRVLTQREVNPITTDRLTFHLAEGIGKHAKPGDYLLISGSPMINAVALTLWILRFGEANILQWNAKRKEYGLTTLTEANMRHLLDRFMLSAVEGTVS